MMKTYEELIMASQMARKVVRNMKEKMTENVSFYNIVTDERITAECILTLVIEAKLRENERLNAIYGGCSEKERREDAYERINSNIISDMINAASKKNTSGMTKETIKWYEKYNGVELVVHFVDTHVLERESFVGRELYEFYLRKEKADVTGETDRLDGQYFVFYGENMEFSDRLKIVFLSLEKIEVPSLEEEDIRMFLNNFCKEGQDISEIGVKWYRKRLANMTPHKVFKIIEEIFERCGYLPDPDSKKSDMKPAETVIREEKNKLLGKNAMLILEEPKALETPVGLEMLENYLTDVADSIKAMSEDAPKGMVLCGPPGTGKSVAANLVASRLGLDLVKCDVGAVLGKHVGETEENTRRMLNDLKRNSPCCLWLDEIEKALSGGNDDGNGVMRRLIGNLLTFMSENKSVFFFATSNDISALPKELLRNCRMDARFAILLPQKAECVAIAKQKIDRYFCEEEEKPDAETLVNLICGTKEDPLFLTGSDIDLWVRSVHEEYVRNNTLDIQVLVERKEPYVRTYTDSACAENIEKVAESYVRFLSEPLVIVQGQDMLFDRRKFKINVFDELDCIADKDGNYSWEDGDLPSCMPLDITSKNDWYDSVLYNTLVTAMNRILLKRSKEGVYAAYMHVKAKKERKNKNGGL